MKCARYVRSGEVASAQQVAGRRRLGSWPERMLRVGLGPFFGWCSGSDCSLQQGRRGGQGDRRGGAMLHFRGRGDATRGQLRRRSCQHKSHHPAKRNCHVAMTGPATHRVRKVGCGGTAVERRDRATEAAAPTALDSSQPADCGATGHTAICAAFSDALSWHRAAHNPARPAQAERRGAVAGRGVDGSPVRPAATGPMVRLQSATGMPE